MNRFAVCGLVIAFAVVGSAQEKKVETKAAFNAERLVGKWTITAGTKNGEKVSDGATKTKMEITKDKIMLDGDQGKFVFKYTLDVKANPVQVDLEMLESPFGAGAKAKGIIEMGGNALKLCYTSEGDRPTKFDGAKAMLFECKKVEAKK